MKPKADILHLFDVPVITLDKTLHIREVNEAFEAIFGDVIGRLVTDFSDDDEVEESKMLWENQIASLKQVLGSR